MYTKKRSHKSSKMRGLITSILLLAVYVAAGKLGLSLAFVNESATAIWPPTGIALAALLIFGYRYSLVIFLGAFLVNITTAGSIATVLLIALGNTLEALVGAFLVNRYALGRLAFERPDSILRFAIFASLFGPALSASLGVWALIWDGLASTTQYWNIWFTWWLGDAAGALIVTPIILIWGSKRPIRFDKKIVAEAVLFACLFLVAGQSVFGPISILGRQNYPVAFLILPFLIWAAAQFGRRGAVATILAMSAFAVWGTLHGYGPFFTSNTNVSLLLLQGFTSIMSVATLAVAALIAQRKEFSDELLEYSDKLAEEKTKDEAVLANIGEGLVVVDNHGIIVRVNKAFEEMLGWKALEVVGHTTGEVLLMEDDSGAPVAEADRPLAQAFVTGKKVTTVYSVLKKNKTKLIAAITATPLVVRGTIIGAIKVFRDVTTEKQMDRAKSEFVSLVSHQLRSPLTAVKWNASALLDSSRAGKSLPRAEQEKYLESIYVTNQRMMDLVNAILDVSKIDLGTLVGEIGKISLPEIAESVLADLKVEIQAKSLYIGTHFAPDLPKITADSRLIRIIFENLLTNSIKYTPQHGKVDCTITPHGKQMMITVADTGCGIIQSDFDKIFTKFFRTDLARNIDPNGNGLGMYIVHAIVQQMGGRIWFESKEGQGTTFYVILPVRTLQGKELKK